MISGPGYTLEIYTKMLVKTLILRGDDGVFQVVGDFRQRNQLYTVFFGMKGGDNIPMEIIDLRCQGRPVRVVIYPG
jgi:hypothetical protein